MHRDEYLIKAIIALKSSYITDNVKRTLGTNILTKSKEDFETVCEARSWLKSITSPLAELTEAGVLDGFSIMFRVSRKELNTPEDNPES